MDNIGEIQQPQLTPQEQIKMQRERMANYEQTKGNDPNAKQAEIVREVGFIKQMGEANKINNIRSEINTIASQPKPLFLPEGKPALQPTSEKSASIGSVALGAVGAFFAVVGSMAIEALNQHTKDTEQTNQRIATQQAIAEVQKPKPLQPTGIGETVKPIQPVQPIKPPVPQKIAAPAAAK